MEKSLPFCSSFVIVGVVVFGVVTTVAASPEVASQEDDFDVASIDAVTAARLRAMAEIVPPLEVHRGFVSTHQQDWMKNLPEKIINMPLSGIAIPGTHDSFTKLLDYKAELGPSPDLSETLQKVINFFGSAAKKIIYNWGVTQGYSLTDQLTAGIRYLDFRVAKRDSKNGEIYLLHSLFAQSAERAFAEVKSFLNNHPKEVVIIDINHFYNMNRMDHIAFTNMILRTFGSRLAPVRLMKDLTIANLWKTDQRVILIYHEYLPERDSRLWGRGHITSPWLQTNSKSEAVKKLDRYYNLGHSADEGFWVTQGVLTPTANDIIFGVISSLRSKLGVPMCQVTSNWVLDKKIGEGGLNVVITDFAEEHNFIDNVIKLNYK